MVATNSTILRLSPGGNIRLDHVMTRMASYMVRDNGPAPVRRITSAWPSKRKRDADRSHRSPLDDRARHDRRRAAAEVGGRRPRHGRRWWGRIPLKPRHRERVDPHHGVPGVGIFRHQPGAFNSGGYRSQATIDHPDLRLDAGSKRPARHRRSISMHSVAAANRPRRPRTAARLRFRGRSDDNSLKGRISGPSVFRRSAMWRMSSAFLRRGVPFGRPVCALRRPARGRPQGSPLQEAGGTPALPGEGQGWIGGCLRNTLTDKHKPLRFDLRKSCERRDLPLVESIASE